MSDQVETKYLKIEIIHWALFLQLALIFVTFLVIFWKKIYEIKFDKEIYEIIFFFNWLPFFHDLCYYLDFYSFLRDEEQWNGNILESNIDLT